MILDAGCTVADYEILDLLGKGGMGIVYRVRNVLSNRIEAMKVLHAALVGEASLVDRFLGEIRTIAALDHPNIAHLHTAFAMNDELFMLMEFVDGSTLSKQIKEAPLSLRQTVDYGIQILSALAYAHERGIIHRDIKPANIIVTADGTAKLMDFGIAKSSLMPALTRPGATLGSVHYMSPEQARGAAIDLRSDLYSMGVLLYELTTGHRPFDGDSIFSILDQHMHAAPKPPLHLNPRMPKALNDTLLRALAKDPADRFQTAACFASALRAGDCGDYSLHVVDAETKSETFPPPPPKLPGEIRPATMPVLRSSRLLWLTIGSTAGISVFCAGVFLLSSSLNHPAAHVGLAAEAGKKQQTLSGTAPSVALPAPKALEATSHRSARNSPQTRTVANSQMPGRALTRRQLVEPDVAGEELGARLLRLRAETAAIESSMDIVRRPLALQGAGLRPEITAALILAQSHLENADRLIQGKKYDTVRQELDDTETELVKLRAVWGR